MKLGTAAAGFAAMSGRSSAATSIPGLQSNLAQLMASPVLRRELWPNRVLIAAVELLKAGDQFLVRVRSKDGATGLAVAHPDVLETTWPILTRRVAPFFVGKDARDLESLVDGVYLASSNYKWQGLPFWVPVASVEFAVLDLLGQIARKPLGELFGTIVTRDVAVYRASGNRGNSPEEEIAFLQKLVSETGAKAIKFRLGARMRFDDASTRRDMALIPLTRKTFGEGMTIYADANGSYDVPTALRIGRVMLEHRLAFMEEPVPFDYYDETKQIADALSLPVAGGEQENSLRRFRWMVEQKGVDVVQRTCSTSAALCGPSGLRAWRPRQA
jgi:L-alanine-DL-glutamate epimerase-like enolase superfamily enzyme